jgi:hypothetical protein
MKRRPIELACYFEYCCIRPEEKWRLAFHRVDVRSTSVNDLIRDDGIHRFTVDRPVMNQGWKANCDREKDNPKHGQAKSS